ncbi:peptidoglycan-binding protein [Geitlerinema sp. P-1104]|uniref:peptidoglycan-binding domain-containing protein n=1 Tax=Geitlerinema sp. P-1104 TaxID=2546230 RepID=UPI001476CB8F|nr:peptidoglycan-binding domain-containing protein [Geitlerinema sp. P-1104]NMG59849.1 peptidoglycan-binding protein [Geitlerinema sp. P-1104]
MNPHSNHALPQGSPLEIHEFSTGIDVKPTASGWESGGFTGVFMNSTLNPIPNAVSEAISNGAFKLAEGASSDSPAMVGREVSGYGEQWSVVAVVTRGKDDRGRPVSLYRYFLTPTVGAIEGILRWMMTRQIGVFDPFDSQILGQPHRTPWVHKDIPLQEHFRSLVSEETPIVIPATIACNPLVLNRFTQELQSSGGMAWAYNVAALERPEYFQAIYPMDAKAEGILRQAIVRSSASSPPMPGDTKIKTAIKACINGRVRLSHIETLEEALNNPQLDEKFWTKLLDKQGASQALNGPLYSSNTIYLLTLKAIITPSFLPTFLQWINQPKQLQSYYQESLKFQSGILNIVGKNPKKLPNISEHLERGICSLIPHLVKNPQMLDAASLLLGSSTGLWSNQYRKSLYSKLENDLDLMRRHTYGQKNLAFQATEYPEWKNFLGQLTPIWQFSNVKKKEYLPLAQLFEEAKTPKPAAFFYQVSKGEIHKSLFFKVSNREWQDQLFGIRIKRQMDLEDVIDIVFFANVNLGGIDMNRLTAILLFAVVFVLGAVGGSVISARSTDQAQETGRTLGRFAANQIQIESWEIFANHIDRTKPALEQLQENLDDNLDTFLRDNPQGSGLPEFVDLRKEGVFIHFLKEVLTKSSDDDAGANGELEEDSEEVKLVEYGQIQYDSMFEHKEYGDIFIRAVKAYQERNELPADGIIDAEGETIQQLQGDISAQLNPSATPE